MIIWVFIIASAIFFLKDGQHLLDSLPLGFT